MTSLLGLVSPVVTSAPPAAEDPWTKVPPLPTACYQEPEDFPTRFWAASEAAQADLDRQQKINDELSERLKQLDPMEQASRMQDYMMAHPEEGMKLMQRNAALSESFTTTQLQSNENLQKLEAELADTLARYNAEVDAVIGPIKAKFKELDVRAQKDLVAVGETWSYAPWAVKEYNALNDQSNKAYEAKCAKWWAAGSPFHGWMKRYKDHLVMEQIPKREEADLLGAGFMVVLVGTPEKPFKSTATIHATLEYIKHAIDLFGNRWSRPGRDY